MKNRIDLKKITAFGMACLLILNSNKFVFAKTVKETFGITSGYGKSNIIVIDNYLNHISNSGGFYDAINNWNTGFNGYTKKYVLKQGSSENYVTESDLSNSTYGVYRQLTYYPSKNWRTTASFCILIHDDNLTTTIWDTLYGKRNWRKGTFTHELGHAMSLADLDDGEHASGYGKKSIMSYDRDRKNLTTPQVTDFCNIGLFK